MSAPPFGWSNPRFPRRTGAKAGIDHVQWSKDVLLRKLIEWHTANTRDDFTERDESDVAVCEASAGWIAEGFLDQSLDGFVVTGPALADIEIRGLTRDVRQ